MDKTVIPSGSVVVGVDGSSAAARALDWAIDQAVLEHRPLTLAHGVGPGQSAWVNQAGFDHQVLLDALRDDAAAILADARQHVTERAPGLEVHQVLRLADPRETLLELSRNAALLVLGSRGRGPVRGLLLGSVSVAVSRHAACPVVVLRPQNRGTVRDGVLVGADGTERSLPTLEFAYRMASLHQLPLTVMHCIWDARSLSAGPAMVLAGNPDLDGEWLLVAESVSGLGEKFPDVRVTREIARGIADDCLVRAAKRMDLVVVGMHQGRPGSALLGSVAASVLEHASGVVAVVPDATR
ncbi:MAG: UspA domain protein [Nocardioides sp.]|nr:UspA domain protein [Nocardioides sp.]